MIQDAHGNLLTAEADALVNTVNTVGVMGKGIALQFKRAFPENYKAYKAACDQGKVQIGQMFIWDAGELVPAKPRFVINFPTKVHWRSRSTLAVIRTGLEDLVRQVRDLPVKSLAVPPLGCGHGGLRWDEVRPLILEALGELEGVEVLLFPPEGAPSAADQPSRTQLPRMTPGRAALIGIMERYLPFAVNVTAVDIQKLMYFMQEAGEPLKLRFAKGRYGPYADNLRHVLASMEGHYISGVGDGSSKALDPIPFEILKGASAASATVLAERPETTARMHRVAELIEGFESAYGLELLATVHWAGTRDEGGAPRGTPASVADIERRVSSWNRRKGQLFKSAHIAKAIAHLHRRGWLEAPGPVGLFATP
ncbi:MAG: type II toxin-antitoxin system antitoxin DNA ADP-ribosyl glycohydrolase DarG [Acidimicrobiales bacterium]